MFSTLGSRGNSYVPPYAILLLEMNHVYHLPLYHIFILTLVFELIVFPLFMTSMQCNTISLVINIASHGFDALWNTSLGKCYNAISVRLQIRLWLLGVPLVISGIVARNT
jgi:hypothetical protein